MTILSYPIRAKVKVLSQPHRTSPLRLGEVTIERVGGGSHTFAEAQNHGIAYYPTVLWAFPTQTGYVVYLRPEEVNLELTEILDRHKSDDPMGAAGAWPEAK